MPPGEPPQLCCDHLPEHEAAIPAPEVPGTAKHTKLNPFAPAHRATIVRIHIKPLSAIETTSGPATIMWSSILMSTSASASFRSRVISSSDLLGSALPDG